jgi:hypothetical protein
MEGGRTPENLVPANFVRERVERECADDGAGLARYGK